MAFALALAGCAGHTAHPAEALGARVGHGVTLEGVAESRKLGAALRGEGFDVWIDRLAAWPAGLDGARVRVTGVLEERHDLPVFVSRPDEPIVAGIPVVEGKDLRAASQRLVVREARWTRLH